MDDEKKLKKALKKALKNEVAPFLIGMRSDLKKLADREIKQHQMSLVMNGKEVVVMKGEKGDSVKGEKGDKPVKGSDYFTPKEIKDFLKKTTPKKNKDYFDGKDGEKPVIGVDYYTEEQQTKLASKILKQATPIKGIHYKDGEEGKPGKKGKDGNTVSAEELRNMLESLKGKSRLKMKAIEGLEEALNSRSGGSGIGGSSCGSGGASAFIGLTDVPNSYTGQGLYNVRVKADESGLEFFPSDESNFVPYVGATGTVNLGLNDIYAKDLFGTDDGQMLIVAKDASGGSGNIGANVFVGAGTGDGTSAGGNFAGSGGNGGGCGNGGNAVFTGGNGGTEADTNGGDVLFFYGTGHGAGSHGNFKFQAQGGFYGILDTDLITADRRYCFPDKSGTIVVDDGIGYVPYLEAFDIGFSNSSSRLLYVEDSTSDGFGGSAFSFRAGAGCGTCAPGGDASVIGGDRGLSGSGGNVLLIPGLGDTACTEGHVQIQNRISGAAAIFDTSFLACPRVFAFPNACGTFALLEADQLFSGNNCFEYELYLGGGAITANDILPCACGAFNIGVLACGFNSGTFNTINLLNGAQAGYVWTSTDTTGVGTWQPAPCCGGCGGCGGTTYTFSDSLVADGSNNVTLVNDVSTPGNNCLYGTDGMGNKGWYAQPSGATTMVAGCPLWIQYNDPNCSGAFCACGEFYYDQTCNIVHAIGIEIDGSTASGYSLYTAGSIYSACDIVAANTFWANGSQGVTASGLFTNLTIVGGIITAAS